MLMLCAHNDRQGDLQVWPHVLHRDGVFHGIMTGVRFDCHRIRHVTGYVQMLLVSCTVTASVTGPGIHHAYTVAAIRSSRTAKVSSCKLMFSSCVGRVGVACMQVGSNTHAVVKPMRRTP